MNNFELVYLWVEEYKNIKGQGFNFSPRCWCEFKPEYKEYKENTETKRKLKDNCELIIKKNENYINIFPANINITAIVGENGSGKSNILEILSEYNLEERTVIKVFQNQDGFLYKVNNQTKIKIEAEKLNIKEITVLYTEIPSNNAIKNEKITNISLWNFSQTIEYSIFDNLDMLKNKMQTTHMVLMKKYGFNEKIWFSSWYQ
jgi:ABC-type phosphate/phosphonate transport system ATPase subunit